MEFSEFTGRIERRLLKPLPGYEAQLKMASVARLEWLKQQFDLTRAKKSGVLILLYPFRETIRTVLILRPEYDGVHGGQAAFPGGKQEESDQSLVETALREAREEIGINPGEVRVIGLLSELYIPPSNYLVLPVIGCIDHQPFFTPDPVEVDQLLELEVFLLFDDKFKKTMTVQAGGYSIEAPCYVVDGVTIWGATAMIFSELLEVIRDF
jgi:8-oxo-dGTP pyrophosphatase MutT (NUDIX family)